MGDCLPLCKIMPLGVYHAGRDCRWEPCDPQCMGSMGGIGGTGYMVGTGRAWCIGGIGGIGDIGGIRTTGRTLDIRSIEGLGRMGVY